MKKICPQCKGNGYVYSFNPIIGKKIPTDCNYCYNQGEIKIKEETVQNLDDAGQIK